MYHSANLLLTMSGQDVSKMFHVEHRKSVLVASSCSRISKEHLHPLTFIIMP